MTRSPPLPWSPTLRPPRRRCVLGLSAVLILLAGCSGRRIAAPQFNPEEAGEQALAEYDLNKDGSLDAKELEHCPSLRSGFTSIDSNKDGRLSAQEITDRVTAYQTSRIGLLSLPCNVNLDGGPLADATVELIPEKFLGPGIKPAKGTSDKSGSVTLQVEGRDTPGVACGFYRVLISKKSASGKETLPPRYNTKTTLGQEIGPDQQNPLRFDLTSQ